MKRPNILLITLDAVRAKNLSIYGYEKDTTPNLKNNPIQLHPALHPCC